MALMGMALVGSFSVLLGGIASGICVRISLVKGQERRGGGGGLVGGWVIFGLEWVIERLRLSEGAIGGTFVTVIEGLRKSSRMFVGMAEFGKSENVPL